jgi:nucleoside-diphosphate-sugar epimerase
VILLTGYSGFLGSAVLRELEDSRLGVLRVGRTSTSDIFWNLNDVLTIPGAVSELERVIHVAGKAHTVPKDEKEAALFHDANVGGMLRLLEGLDAWIHQNQRNYPKQFVFISSVAVYGLDAGENIGEDFPCNPPTPYGKSKLQAEELVLEWGKKHGVAVLILRLPLIWGENAPGNLGAMEKAIRKGYYFRIGSGDAVRSIVDIGELSNFIAQLKGEEQGIYNLASCNVNFKEIEQYFRKKYKLRIKVIPRGFAQILAKIGDLVFIFPLNSYRLQKIENSLTFDASKAIKNIGWIRKEWGK